MDNKIYFNRIGEEAKKPYRGSDRAAGWDLYTAEAVALQPYLATIIKTNLSIELPEGTMLLVVSRSGFATKNQVIMPNSIGIIDEDYRGAVGITAMWTPRPEDVYRVRFKKEESSLFASLETDRLLSIPAGTRLAQAVLVEYRVQDWEESSLSLTKRGSGGFGHTGDS